MNNKSIMKALKEKPMNFSLNEIQQIMDDELNKEPAEMNTKLVDLCAEAIEKHLNSSKTKKLKWLPQKKALACAAVIAIVIGVTIPAIANYTDNNSILVEYEDSCIVNLDNGEHKAIEYNSIEHNLIKRFEEKGLKNLALPNALIDVDDIDFFIVDPNERTTFARADFNYNNGTYCSVIIVRATDESIAEDIGNDEHTVIYQQKNHK